MTGGYSDDLSRFKQTYFDECGELLAVAEAGLLRLSPQNIDLDEINAVFRAVHSIKGGGGTFGFSDLVAFTHEFEAVMDRLRSQQIGVTIEIVDVLIRANDVMAQLLTCARDNRATPPGLTDAAAADLKRFLAAVAKKAEKDEPVAEDALRSGPFGGITTQLRHLFPAKAGPSAERQRARIPVTGAEASG